MSAPTRPLTLLIAALGGEGGHVLSDWIVAAAARQGFPVQSTSIPGVAQRTGATTYYIEMVPVPLSQLGERRPILALAPGIGDVDRVVASELLEAGRTVANGFVTPDRTCLIASSSRSYLVVEKMAMGDGRYDGERLLAALKQHAQQALLIDMEALAKDSGAMVNAVMLGAIAGCGRLPIPVEAFEAVIRAEGKAVDGNLRGFRAGLNAARAPMPVAAPVVVEQKPAPSAGIEAFEQEIAATMPVAAQAMVAEGVRRLTAYQGSAYARLYLQRLASIRAADQASGAGGRLLQETARHLAVRMSFEDIIRVAQAKIAPERLRRIAQDELHVVGHEPFAVYDVLKPGIEELCQILPPLLARPILRLATRMGWLGRVYWGMEINSTSISGYLRFRLLAALKRWRPYGHRYREEQAAIEAWLALIEQAARLSAELAAEVVECARLIKGYGDTHARGLGNYRIIESRLIGPLLAGTIPLARGVDALASARTAALVDPEGEALARCLAEFEGNSSFKVAAE